MPKILDLIYRVKDDASERLREIKRRQDEVGKSSESLRQTLKGLKASWTELKSAISLAKQAYEVIHNVIVGSAQDYQEWTIKQYAAAKASGTLTDELERQNALIQLNRQLVQETETPWIKLGQVMEEVSLRQHIASTLMTEDMKSVHEVTNAQIDDEIERRLALVEVQKKQTAQVDGLQQALQNLQPYLHNEITIDTRSLSDAEAGAIRLLGYLKQISDRRWGINVGGVYVGPDVPSPASGGGGGGGGTIVVNGQVYNDAQWINGYLFVRGQNTGISKP